MKRRLLILSCVLLAAGASADVVTLKNGTKLVGTVVSLDASTLVVKSDAASQTVTRADVRSIELGTVLVSGIQDNVYTNKGYRGRFTAPAGWSMYKQAGVDFAAKKATWTVFSRSILTEGYKDGGQSVIKGAIAGMAASIPEAVAGQPAPTTWNGINATRVDVTSPKLDMAAYFIPLPSAMVMFVAVASPTDFDQALQSVTDWQKGFSLIPD